MKTLLALLLTTPGPFQIGPAELPWAAVDRSYNQVLTIRGGVLCADNDLRVRAEGALPEGLDLTSSGQFTGIPIRTGVYRFLVRAENVCDASVRPYTLVVTGAPLLLVGQEEIEFHYRRGGPPPPPQRIQVRSTWPGQEYGVEKAGVPWLRAVPRSGRTPRAGAAVECDLVEVVADPADMAAGEYQATLRLWTWQGANAPAVQVRLKVE
jgi:hypothetical protein